MNQFQIPKPSGLYLKAGEKIPTDLLDKLSIINDKYTKSRDFEVYFKSICNLFQVTNPPVIDESTKLYLAGFVEGEGSLNIGAKKNKTSLSGVYFDPEFSVTQHVNGVSNLILVLALFRTGRLRHKGGSNATMTYTIDNRQSLSEKVVPFFENYTQMFQVANKQRRAAIFKQSLILFEEQAHLDQERLVNEVAPLWHAMRMQEGQKNQTFESLEDAQKYIRECYSTRGRRNK